MKTVEDVKNFWEQNPLFSGESKYEPGSKDFFEEHKQVYYADVFAGKFPESLMIPKFEAGATALDLGCGVGFWVIEILERNPGLNMYAADLTENALQITQKRLQHYGHSAQLDIQNAENLTYEDAMFDHVNCQGVIHHTPNTQACIKEIARVLKPGGTAYISVYYRNIFIRNWKLMRPLGKLLYSIGARFKGRGRENIFLEKDEDEITRLYDGDQNPIGKSYSRQDFSKMLKPYFEIDQSFLYFFPSRALPFSIPKPQHRYLARHMGFMIHFNLRKPS